MTKNRIFAHIAFIAICVTVATASLAGNEMKDDEITKYTIKDYLLENLPPQEGRKIALDEISGLLTVTDTPENHNLIRQLIKEWDIRPKQVQIEAKFIEITFTDLNEMGVDWQLISTEHPGIIAGTDLFGAGSATAASTFTEAASMAGMGFFIGKATMTGSQLLAYIKALEQSGKVNLLNAPRITTLSGQMANLQIVRTFPYASSAERTQLEYTTILGELDVYPVETYDIAEEITGIVLQVVPTVLKDSDIITLDLYPEVSKLSSRIPISSLTELSSDESLFPSELGWPVIDTRSTQTSLMVRSGDTIILGGLIQDQDQDTIERKVPLLGDIPFLGNLFKYKYENREKKNLVVLITATMIDLYGDEELND
ncbi:MAG: type II secretion system protein GspD [Candidatus Omnitrophica bacterium]|nr:type II secretion system protein GspD [Candidatus Omnitrophota bacterium]